MVVIKAVKGISQNKEDSVLSKLKEIDKEKQALKGNLELAKKKLSKVRVDSMMRIFWKKEVKRLEDKIGK